MKKILLLALFFGFCYNSYAQGDTCATAVELTCGNFFPGTPGSTTGLSDTAGNSTEDGFDPVYEAIVEIFPSHY